MGRDICALVVTHQEYGFYVLVSSIKPLGASPSQIGGNCDTELYIKSNF